MKNLQNPKDHPKDHPNSPIKNFNRDALVLDTPKEIERITAFLQRTVNTELHRQGAVVGISGGIDSSVVLALSARAFGPDRVVGIMLPERESSPESAELATCLAERLGVRCELEEITAALEGAGCYRRRDEAIQRVFPDYTKGWKAKIGLPTNLLEQATMNVFHLTVTSPAGEEFSKRLAPREYYQIVAASNFKQRARMAMLYYHAELHNFAVIGTANKNEYALGFFVKYGDGGADVSPIGHLYKTQVFQLARHLNIPEEIQERTPTTDTYPGGSTQEEFFYRIPFDLLDTIWYGFEHHVPNEQIAAGLDLTPQQVDRVIADIISKQRTTAYLRTPLVSMNDG